MTLSRPDRESWCVDHGVGRSHHHNARRGAGTACDPYELVAANRPWPMSTRRTAKIAQAVRHVVSNAVLFELRDPRIQHVTVIGVDVAPDLRTAKVRVSVLGDDKVQRRAVEGLTSAHGFLQALIADELQLRYTPVLTFELDQGVKNSIAVSRLLRELDEQRDSTPPAADAAAPEDEFNSDDLDGAADEAG